MDDARLESLAARAVEAARAAGATASDALAIAATDVNASVRNGAPETIERAESAGIGLRVFVGQASATLSSSELTEEAMRNMAEQAVAIAKVAPADPFAGLAAAELLAKSWDVPDIYDTALPEMNQLQATARAAEEAGRSVAGITNSNGADASASHHKIALVTSHGFSAQYKASHFSLSLSLIAGSGETMQRDYAYATTTHLSDLLSPETLGQEAAERAVSKLNPRKLASQSAVVYFEPRVGRQLLGAFAGAISGSAIARGTSFLKDALGTAVFAPGITVTDDPTRPRSLGSHPFDAEGVRATPRDFISDGILTSWVLDTRSANQLGLVTTGHASRGLSGTPHPSTSNLYLAAGSQSPEALMRDLGNGFYVTETIGHGTNLITGDFSLGASGFWIENGQRAYPVSEVTIAGNLRDMLRSITAANDLEFRYGTNVPTLAVARMTIAGN